MTCLSSASALCWQPWSYLSAHVPPLPTQEVRQDAQSTWTPSGRQQVLCWISLQRCISDSVTSLLEGKRQFIDFAIWKGWKCYLLSWNTCHAQTCLSLTRTRTENRLTSPYLLCELYSVNIKISRASSIIMYLWYLFRPVLLRVFILNLIE